MRFGVSLRESREKVISNSTEIPLPRQQLSAAPLTVVRSAPILEESSKRSLPWSSLVKMYYEVHGREDGPPLLAFTAWRSLYSWRNFVAAGSPLTANYKVITIDLKGCGKSPKPNDTRYHRWITGTYSTVHSRTRPAGADSDSEILRWWALTTTRKHADGNGELSR